MNETLLDQLIHEERPPFQKRGAESFCIVGEKRRRIEELTVQAPIAENQTSDPNQSSPPLNCDGFFILSNNFRNYFIKDEMLLNHKRSGRNLELVQRLKEECPDLANALIKGLTRVHKYYEGLIPPEIMKQFNSRLHRAYLIMRQWQSDEVLFS